MKALVLEQIGKIAYRDVIDKNPLPNDGYAVVEVHAAGICGSDIPRAYRTGAHNMPLILGHEFSGKVICESSDDKRNLCGKRVGVFPLIPCKKCAQCESGHYEMCENYNYLGSRCDGGFAEQVMVPSWNLIELPDGVTYEQAAMLEPMAVAVHAMRQIYNHRVGISTDTILISGLGTIGLLLCMFLIDAGANSQNLYVIGNKPLQKKLACEIGIPEDNYFDTTEDISIDNVDICFECIGINESLNRVIKMIAPSGEICLVGNPASDMNIAKETYWKILRRQVTLHGTWNSSYQGSGTETNSSKIAEIKDDWKYAIERLNSGSVHPEILITHKFDLENILSGFELMRDKKEPYIKVLMVRDYG